jgi:acetyl-CoA carboxylase biotin carboxylase subunit
MGDIKKVLVANRGEIALRVMKTCYRMNIKTVAIFSDADQKAPFVKYADEKIYIGPSPSNKSYLNQDLIIKSAIDYEVDAIHPGYGFLSENFEFAQKVVDAGLIFIGPSPLAIEVMGDKLSAKKTVSKFKIPLVPGLDEEITDLDLAMNTAENIGFPILIKASAGGGGKGMRIVHHKKEFKQQMERAVSEAEKSFGNGAVFIEKYLEKPRHIEIQILADQHGNVVYLFERDCSVQRRHQKVIEEAPSSVLSEKLRKEMGEAACKVAKSCNYHGAGTVEFIFQDEQFYFLEMNTRLQVEHPVTEMITGLDLVEQQIIIANNQRLNFSQSDLKINGHSIEVRVCAEDPFNNFLPDTGIIELYEIPHGNGVRVDDCTYQGAEVSIYYDPMISKLIVHANNRVEAIQKMINAINNYTIYGVKTTLPFCKFALNHPDFRNGNFDTRFVNLFIEDFKNSFSSDLVMDAGLAAIFKLEKLDAINVSYLPSETNNWKNS